jgi:hypothetical protein
VFSGVRVYPVIKCKLKFDPFEVVFYALKAVPDLFRVAETAVNRQNQQDIS